MKMTNFSTGNILITLLTSQLNQPENLCHMVGTSTGVGQAMAWSIKINGHWSNQYLSMFLYTLNIPNMAWSIKICLLLPCFIHTKLTNNSSIFIVVTVVLSECTCRTVNESCLYTKTLDLIQPNLAHAIDEARGCGSSTFVRRNGNNICPKYFSPYWSTHFLM